MKKFFFAFTLIILNRLSFAQKDTASTRKKIELGMSCGYGIPFSGGDFGKYYKGSLLPELTFGYRFNPHYAVQVGANYSMFPINSLTSYVTDKQYRMLVNNPPYTDLVGGDIRVIGINARGKRTSLISSKLELHLMAGLSLVFLEKSPIDATVADGTYQILEHYVHEKAFGVNAGAALGFRLSNAVILQAVLNYNLYFTSYVVDKAIGTLSPQIGVLFRL